MNCITLYRDCFKTVKSNREISQQGRSKTRNATGRYWTRFRRAHATPDSPWSLRIATPHFAHRRRHPRHRTQPTMTTGSVRTLRPSPELHPSSRGWGFKSGNQRPPTIDTAAGRLLRPSAWLRDRRSGEASPAMVRARPVCVEVANTTALARTFRVAARCQAAETVRLAFAPLKLRRTRFSSYFAWLRHA